MNKSILFLFVLGISQFLKFAVYIEIQRINLRNILIVTHEPIRNHF